MVNKNMPILFGAESIHVDFDDKGFGEITSAGFVLLEYVNNKVQVKAYGSSSSLNIGTAANDSAIIYNYLFSEDPSRDQSPTRTATGKKA